MPIRAASPAELETVYRMGFDTWAEGRSLDAYLAACRTAPKYAGGTWWVDEDAGGRLTSSLLAHEIPLPSGSPAVGLGSIATPPELRGQGHGSRLIAVSSGAGRRRAPRSFSCSPTSRRRSTNASASSSSGHAPKSRRPS